MPPVAMRKHGQEISPAHVCFKKVLAVNWFSDICLPAPVSFGVKKTAYWGMNARTRVHTPICGGLPREFLKNL
jgi:hypothetical protein